VRQYWLKTARWVLIVAGVSGTDWAAWIEARLRPSAARYPTAASAQILRFHVPVTVQILASFGLLRAVEMCSTCAHAQSMAKMIQIRNVPEALHRRLKSRAAVAGRSLSDYLLAEIERVASLPTREEMLERIHRRSKITLTVPAAEVIRRERDSQ